MPCYKNIVVLTGAGVSAESGLGTFRDKDGLWTRYDLNEVATPEGFARDPSLVHAFYNIRRRNVLTSKPNSAHSALANLEHGSGAAVLLVTQNVDNLHEQAGSQNLLHMHGELLKVRCTVCKFVGSWLDDLSVSTACPQCPALGALRPDVVWFGEMPKYMHDIYDALSHCDLFISVGTSGSVYPANGFVAEAHAACAHTVELNLEPSEGASLFTEKHYGPATETVPQYVNDLLAQNRQN